VLIYATSNRRHLMPEKMSENLAAKHTEDGEIHPGEVVRGEDLAVGALRAVGRVLPVPPGRLPRGRRALAARHFGCDDAQVAAARGDALRWALERGSRSGRVAWQFARDWAGRERGTAP
jgi:uncharacterized protein